MYHKKLRHPSQKLLLLHGGKTVKSHLVGKKKPHYKTALCSTISLNFFFFKFIGLHMHETKSEIINTKY